jgi:PAT family beta-lactamase induction signal transducer AmpG
MAFARTGAASGSGYMADQAGWPLFFVLTIVLAVPSVLIIFFSRKFLRKDSADGLT